MLILDTDHLSEIDRGSAEAMSLLDQLSTIETRIGTTIVSVEEQLRGLLALLRAVPDVMTAVATYDRFHRFVADVSAWDILPLTATAAEEFQRLRSSGIRIGAMDLKIACIALVNDATLLSRNLRDFQKIPNLKVENWLDR